MTVGASVSGAMPAALYGQTGRYSFENQPRVLWRREPVLEDIQRKSQYPAGPEHDQPRSGTGDSGVAPRIPHGPAREMLPSRDRKGGGPSFSSRRDASRWPMWETCS